MEFCLKIMQDNEWKLTRKNISKNINWISRYLPAFYSLGNKYYSLDSILLKINSINPEFNKQALYKLIGDIKKSGIFDWDKKFDTANESIVYYKFTIKDKKGD